MISWTFTDGFSFQIAKIKEIAELWSDQRSRSPKKKTKTTLSMQFARRDAYISHDSFVFPIPGANFILANVSFRVSLRKYRASHVLVDWVMLTWIWDVPPPCLGSR